MDSAEQQVSSYLTPFFKFAFAPAWLFGFGLGTLMLLFRPEDVVYNGVRGGVTFWGQLLFVGGFTLGAWILGFYMLPAKKVTLTPQGLRISNYRREILVPYSMVESVTQSLGEGNAPVTITLRVDPGLGTTIRFFPAIKGQRFFKEHDCVLAIRERAALLPPGRRPAES